MKRDKGAANSALASTVAALRAEALASEDGAFIGSEDALLTRHGVSRPTLRQAAALVAQEQLLQVKRGVGGGYVARRPTSRGVAHMASIYLRTRGSGLEEVVRSVEPIRTELARLAATCLTPATAAELRLYLESEAALAAEGLHFRGFLKGEREFGRVLGLASGNHVLSLFLEILYDLAGSVRREDDLIVGRPERMALYRQRRIQIVEAVLEGDSEMAVLASRRCSALGMQWMSEDAVQADSDAPSDLEERPAAATKSSRAARQAER